MKRKNFIIGIALLLTVALFASAAMAWGPGCAGCGRGMRYALLSNVPTIPNLTPEQASKIQTIREAYLKEITPLQQQLLAKRLELHSLWLSPNPDQAKINALQKDILNLTAKLQEKSTNARLEVIKVLTPEQQAQLTMYGPFIGYGRGKMARMGCW